MKSHYKIPPVGTILPAQLNETVDNPGPVNDPTKRAEWEQADAQEKAYNQNLLIAGNWLAEGGGWGRWLNEYQSGRMMGPKGEGDPNAPPPVPPRAKVVEVKEAEAGGVYFDIVDGDKPVCKVPRYTKITAPQHYTKGPK